jgi:predicted kinase
VVYRELFARAGALISGSQTVVLDGAFLTDALRREALELAGTTHRALLVDCHCPADEAQRRINDRLARGGDASQARPELHAMQAQQAEPLAAELFALVVDTTEPLGDQVARVCERLAEC